MAFKCEKHIERLCFQCFSCCFPFFSYFFPFFFFLLFFPFFFAFVFFHPFFFHFFAFWVCFFLLFFCFLFFSVLKFCFLVFHFFLLFFAFFSSLKIIRTSNWGEHNSTWGFTPKIRWRIHHCSGWSPAVVPVLKSTGQTMAKTGSMVGMIWISKNWHCKHHGNLPTKWVCLLYFKPPRNSSTWAVTPRVFGFVESFFVEFHTVNSKGLTRPKKTWGVHLFSGMRPETSIARCHFDKVFYWRLSREIWQVALSQELLRMEIPHQLIGGFSDYPLEGFNMFQHVSTILLVVQEWRIFSSTGAGQENWEEWWEWWWWWWWWWWWVFSLGCCRECGIPWNSLDQLDIWEQLSAKARTSHGMCHCLRGGPGRDQVSPCKSHVCCPKIHSGEETNFVVKSCKIHRFVIVFGFSSHCFTGLTSALNCWILLIDSLVLENLARS